MPITALYASLLALIFLVLSVRVIGLRRVVRIGLGDGGDAALLRRVRVHANFAEYVPLCLILIGLAESLRASPVLLHGLGGSCSRRGSATPMAYRGSPRPLPGAFPAWSAP